LFSVRLFPVSFNPPSGEWPLLFFRRSKGGRLHRLVRFGATNNVGIKDDKEYHLRWEE
jgi:hypothetical protein